MGTDDETPDAQTPATPSFAEQDDLTVDAFQLAVQRALRDKLGDDDTRVAAPRGADEMVANVLSALTGKDAKSALKEVRDRLAHPGATADNTDTDNVIDFQAAREARSLQQSALGKKIGSAVSDTFRQFMSTYAEQHGDVAQVNLDAKFLKDNGPQLLGNLFQSLAAAFLTPTAPSKPTAPAPVDIRPDGSLTTHEAEAAPTDEAAPAEGAASEAAATHNVNVKLDVGSILAGLFKPRTPPTSE